MFDLAARVIEVDDLFTRQRPVFHRHASKISAELVVLILRPFLEGVIVAFVAIKAGSEKSLADILGDLSRLPQNTVIIDCRVLIGAAPGEQYLADEFVVGLVCCNRLSNPIAVGPNRLFTKDSAVALQKVSPF